MILVVAVAGLCTRMRVADAGLTLARQIGQPITLLGRHDKIFESNFDTIAEFPQAVGRLIAVRALSTFGNFAADWYIPPFQGCPTEPQTNGGAEPSALLPAVQPALGGLIRSHRPSA